MKNLYLLLIYTLLFPVCLFAQGENDNWYFGIKAGLNFSTSTPTVLLDSEMSTHEAVGVVSDSDGELLFYTDSATIWNRDHGIMVTGLTGNESTGQTYIVPHPNNSNLFYVFTMPEGMTTSYIAYSIVDMNLGSLGIDGNPLGGVAPNNKNIPILDENGLALTYTTEAVTGTMHNDNQSVWVLIPHGSKLYSYKVDANGFNNLPVTSNLNFSGLFEYFGTIKISPNLPSSLGLSYTNFVAINRWDYPYKEMIVHSFDNSTGLLTNDYQLVINSTKSYIGDFTSSGLLLYAGPMSLWGDVLVFDLFGDPNYPNNIMDVIHNSNVALGAIQRAANDEIYLSYLNHGYISKIVNPDSFTNAYVDPNNIYLSGRDCRIGLPQLVPVRDPSGNSCLESLILNVPETNNSFTYETSNTITTNQNYVVDVSQNITLSAGNAIEMLPTTYLKAGSTVLAMIEGCVPSGRSDKNATFETTKTYIDLDGEEKGKRLLTVYPNPAKEYVTVSLKNSSIAKIKLFSLDGKVLVNKTNVKDGDTTIMVETLNKGVYIISVESSNGEIFTEKVSKI